MAKSTTKDSYDVKGTFDSLLDNASKKKIESLYKKITPDSEFELMFFNYKGDKNRMGLEDFLNLLKYLTFKGKKLKIEKYNVLDVIYSDKKSLENYRFSIQGIKNINKYMEMLHQRKNHVIFNVLADMYNKTEDFELIKKKRNKDNIIDIDDFDVRVRMADELKVSKIEIDKLKNLNQNDRQNIIFRYKQRVSVFVEDNKDVTIRLDLTNTKMGKNINSLERMNPIYELELELVSKKKSPDMKYLDIIYKETTTIIKILQQSNFIITKTQSDNIINYYKNLLEIKTDTLSKLDGRKAQSLEVQHVVDQLPNKYAVTDKADGERYFLIIFNNVVYLISFNLHVKNTGIVLPKTKSGYNGSVLDGEYIFIQGKNKHIFMCFDCLFNSGNDIRKKSEFMDRLKDADDIIANCFISKDHKGFKYKEYDGKFDTDKIIKFHDNQIVEFMNNLNNDINKEKEFPLIRRKYFIGVFGVQNNEIFKYSKLLWNKYTFANDINCPYTLDGLIYHPLDQKYITSVKETKYLEYKWKPPEKNSIDFYIRFERARDSNKILTLYDNSKDEYVRGKPYKIVNLYVGRASRGVEKPILFQEEIGKHQGYLFLIDDEVRDIEGNIIQDDTIVEFYYNNDTTIPDKHRWVPLRTRHDKTEFVKRYNKSYGNYFTTANKVWRSIRNPFVIEDVNILSQDKIYDKHIEILRGKIDHSVILSEMKENVYYQIRTSLAKPMRNFHNWLKSIIIYTHCNPTYEEGKSLTVLDIACGRGGDVMKFYYARVEMYVGVDIDNNGLISPVDGAVSRYNQLRKTHPNFPRMYFIHADGGAPLNYEDQYQVLGGMARNNKDLMNKFFSKDDNKRKKFDRINCQFAVHYFLANDTTWNNFIQNVNDYLKPGGYLMLTCFDARRIIKEFGDKDQYTSYYTNTKGEKKVLFEIVKKYDKVDSNKPIGTGYPIDIHNALISQEGVYITEYLVDKNFLEKQFLEKCNMELVETDLFSNQFNIHKNYFKNVVKYEENEKTRKFLLNAAQYYDQENEVNKAAYNMTKLNRYYIFRKIDQPKSSQKGGQQQNSNISSHIEGDNHQTINVANLTRGGQHQTIKVSDLTGGTGETVETIKTGEGSLVNQSKNEVTDYILYEAESLLPSTKFIRRGINNLPDYSFLTSVHDVLKNSNMIPNSTSVMDFYSDINYTPMIDNEINKKCIKNLCSNMVISYEYSDNADKANTEDGLAGINMLVLENDCNGVDILAYSKGNKLSRKQPTIILFKDGDKYQPIYKIKDDGYVGMFDTRMKFIKDLIDQSNGELYKTK